MIRSRDENTTKTRKLNGTVPLVELPNLMRAMGYYPTEMEVRNMIDEVQMSNYAETGQKVDSVDLNSFIRLFVNHRPVYGIGKNNIDEAFKNLMGADRAELGTIPKDELLSMLQTEGECMSTEELENCLFQLVSDRNFKTALKENITCEDFSENVLGFEEVDEVEDDEEEYGQEGGDQFAMGGGATGLYPNDVIPEEDT